MGGEGRERGQEGDIHEGQFGGSTWRTPSPVIQLIAHLGAGGGWVIDATTVHNQVTLHETVLDGPVGLVQSVEKPYEQAWGSLGKRKFCPWTAALAGARESHPSQQAAPQVTDMPGLRLLPPTRCNKSLIYLLFVLHLWLNTLKHIYKYQLI